jgi:signal recognition particle subunit SRP54
MDRGEFLGLFGPNGSGKTTTAGKLALLLKKSGRKVLLVSCDIYRPAAQKQLQILSERAGVGFFTIEKDASPQLIAKKGIEKAISSAQDVVIIDTAGRTQLHDEMMQEAQLIKQAISPRESILVVDAMTGQEACKVAEAFDQTLGITGVILTKIDSDARGGAALSIAKVTGKPIKFASNGEKLEDFQAFHPDRMASRILRMGDVLTLIETAEESFDLKKAEQMEKAAQLYRNVLAQQPDMPEALLNLGHVLESLGQEEEARECWSKALEAKPALAQGYFGPAVE